MGARSNPINSTKERIFRTAAYLFSEYGYSEVSMRDIAKEVGISVSSIYNHYASKEDLLSSLYAFYAEVWDRDCPSLAELLALAEHEPPAEVLMRLDFRFDPADAETIIRIVSIATRQLPIDPESERFFRQCVFENSVKRTSGLLSQLIALGKIHDLPVQTLASLVAYFSLCAVVTTNTTLQMGLQEWQEGLRFLFSAVRPRIEGE